MADLQLQPSLQLDKRSNAHLDLIERLGDLDLTSILLYRLNSLVDSATLPMAWQFDVLNPLLLPLASNTSQLTNITLDPTILQQLNDLVAQLATASATEALYITYRILILLSTPLHATMGTPASLMTALAILGVPQAVIQEGQNSWGGNQYPSNQGWAVFRITIDIKTLAPNTNFTTLTNSIIALANFWKPARCLFDSVQFTFGISELLLPPPTDFLLSAFGQADLIAPLPSDVIAAPFYIVTEIKTIVPFYNAQYYFTSVTYGGTQPAVAEGPLVVNGNAIAN